MSYRDPYSGCQVKFLRQLPRHEWGEFKREPAKTRFVDWYVYRHLDGIVLWLQNAFKRI